MFFPSPKQMIRQFSAKRQAPSAKRIAILVFDFPHLEDISNYLILIARIHKRPAHHYDAFCLFFVGSSLERIVVSHLRIVFTVPLGSY
jgi:hypothetical protein